MQALPEPVAREPVHTRAITTQGYLRHDGLWDLDAEPVDTTACATTTNGRKQVDAAMGGVRGCNHLREPTARSSRA